MSQVTKDRVSAVLPAKSLSMLSAATVDAIHNTVVTLIEEENAACAALAQLAITPTCVDATLTPVISGGVASITIVNPGSGFTSFPTVEFSAGNATATVKMGVVSATPVSITATVGRTLAFSSVTQRITASTGSFITDGFLAGDRIFVTGATDAVNNGWKTVDVVSALYLHIVETLVTEGAHTTVTNIKMPGLGYAVGDILTVAPPKLTATAGRTLTFNVARTITAGGASAGSFIVDGYLAGDRILVEGTAANNGYYTIKTVAATVLTLIDTDVLVTASTYTSSASITWKGVVGGNAAKATLRVTAVNSTGGIVSVTPIVTAGLAAAGNYSTLPTLNANHIYSKSNLAKDARLNLSMGVSSTTITSAGTGYATNPTINLDAGSGTGATATCTLKANSFTPVAAGTAWVPTDTFTIDGTGATSTVAATGTVATTKAVSATKTATAGTGYVAGEVLTVAGGTGTAATITVTKTKLVSATTLVAGTGYVPGSTLTVVGGTLAGGGTAATITLTSTKLVVAPTLSAAGTTYYTGNIITLAAGDGTMTTPATLTVSTTKVVSATVTAGNAGAGNLGDGAGVIVEGTSAAGTKFRASVTIAANAIASVQSITVAGSYTVEPTLIGEPVIYISGAASGDTLTGAQLDIVMGVATFAITNAGAFTTNTTTFTQASIAQGAGIGVGGLGFTCTATNANYGMNVLTTTATVGPYTTNPTIAGNAVTGGSGANGTATLVMGVDTLTLLTGGSYTANPALTNSPTGIGTGCTATLVMGINTATVTEAGTYTALPTNFLTNAITGSGTGIAATMLINWGVKTVTFTGAGSGFVSAEVAFSTSGSTQAATATATVLAGGIVLETVTADTAGAGYTSRPTVTINGGGTGINDNLTAQVTGRIDSITVTDGGTGYDVNVGDAVITAVGTGTGFAAGAITLLVDAVQSVAITTKGTGYRPDTVLNIIGGHIVGEITKRITD